VAVDLDVQARLGDLALARRGVGGSTSARSPAASRTTRMTGWMRTWMPDPRAPSSIVTESTMNGMSSVTISTTVCGEVHACCSNSGL
jgi:hypothetical protein